MSTQGLSDRSPQTEGTRGRLGWNIHIALQVMVVRLRVISPASEVAQLLWAGTG